MADEIIDGAPQGGAEVTAVPDLRSTIAAAVEAQRNPEPVADAGGSTETPVDGAAATDKGKTETEAERNARLRDEKGKFATEKNAVKGPAKEAAKPGEQVAAADVPKADATADDKAILRPPPGWSPGAKVAFDNLPPEVKQAVAQREIEVNKGFEKLTRFKPIERFDEMARQSGTTLDKALENYVGMETKLRQDFPAGILELCQRQGINPVALAQHILARNGAAPSNGQAGADAQVRQQAPITDPAIVKELAALKNFVQQQQSSAVQTEIQRFASDPKHTFFENVKAQMGQLISTGQAADLEDAYDKACWANKEIRALLIKQQTPAAPSANAADAVSRAKAAAKATGGAPSAGFKPNAGTAGASIRDTVVAAVNAQRGL
jgi:hypothetical protein